MTAAKTVRMTVHDIMWCLTDVISFITMWGKIPSAQTWETKLNIQKEHQYLTAGGEPDMFFPKVCITWWFDCPCLHLSCTHMQHRHTLLSNFAMSNLFLWENTCKSEREHIHSTQQEHFRKAYGGMIHSKRPRKIFTTTRHFPSLRVLQIQAAIVALWNIWKHLIKQPDVRLFSALFYMKML